MAGKLCIIVCQNFRPEVTAVVAGEGWPDVTVAAFPSRCGHPPLSWGELSQLLPEGCTQVVILGRACLHDLGSPPADWPPIRRIQEEECFNLVAGATLVAEAIERGAYLLTPGWLEDWRGNLNKMGFDRESEAGFFHDFARELLLLDTGVVADAPCQFAELANEVGLPASRLAVGIDYTRQHLARLVAEWRLDEARRQTRERERDHTRALADHKFAMDFLGRLPLLKDERDTIAAIEEMFHMLFAPQEFHYIRFEGGTVACDNALPSALSRQVRNLGGDWAWTNMATGFLLRIARAGETLGVVAVDHFAFPEYCHRYLDLALSIAGVAGLSIDNARTYQRIKETDAALQKSERSLKIAQAMAHIGHWEMDIGKGEFRWSDETYRILGYEPAMLNPGYDTFIQAIHPEDRARVASHIKAAGAGNRFDIEFKIVLPDARVRVLHGIGEVICSGVDTQPQTFGTIQDITPQKRSELLGVIQDITDRKEMEWKLEQEAHTDPLTGCANRRYFLELAERELARAQRYTEQVSVLMLDLDHFKAINDKHGHQAGDLVLQKFVQVCKLTLRAEDLIGRLGGEEFAILLPETGRNKALDAAERVCRAVAATEVPLEGVPPIRFTASIGVATLAPEESSIEAIFGRADQALYEAKHAGRNRVVAG